MRKKHTRWLWLPALIPAAVFLISAWQLYGYWWENYQSQVQTKALAEQAVTVFSPPAVTAIPGRAGPTASEISRENGKMMEEECEIPISVDFDILQAENPDLVAWIYCAGTPINYPVAQSGDNTYYLRRLPDGSENPSGTLFLDCRNAADFEHLNTIIYGHNMKNEEMFGTLPSYSRQEYYDTHPQLWILTRQCAYRVELLAGFVTAADSEAYTLFQDTEEMHRYLRNAMDNSTFCAAPVDVEGVARIVTLSTCSYENPEARYVLLGGLIPVAYSGVRDEG